MDAKSAAQLKRHTDIVVKELTLALTLAKGACAADEFLRLRTSVGDIIARVDGMLVDGMLYETIYKDHPDLDETK
ncbi:hypothetical protein [Bradyrhizobium sp. AZCC 2230]|uniref:hypothetical protein n=1 Tax=Bradyrhizobium sp. AZCC 2230 TaxID=3117021 RepID=UPI002FF344A8